MTIKNAVKKVIKINNRITSMQLNILEWDALKDVSQREALPRNKLIEDIELQTPCDCSLTSQVRLFLTCYFQAISPQVKTYKLRSPRHKTLKEVLKKIK